MQFAAHKLLPPSNTHTHAHTVAKPQRLKLGNSKCLIYAAKEWQQGNADSGKAMRGKLGGPGRLANVTALA